MLKIQKRHCALLGFTKKCCIISQSEVGSFAVLKRDMALHPTLGITDQFAITNAKGTGIIESANLFLVHARHCCKCMPFKCLLEILENRWWHQTPGRILFSPVEGLVGLLPILGVALQAPVDNVECGAKPQVGSYSTC